MQQFGSVRLGLFHWLGECLPEYVIRHNSTCEPCIPRNRVLQLYVLLSILKHCLRIAHLLLALLLRQTLLEWLTLRDCELIVVIRVKVRRLNHQLSITGWTETLLLGTPTISAAVRWSICEGGILTYCCVDTYLYFDSISWPLIYPYRSTFNVIFPYVFP